MRGLTWSRTILAAFIVIRSALPLTIEMHGAAVRLSAKGIYAAQHVGHNPSKAPLGIAAFAPM